MPRPSIRRAHCVQSASSPMPSQRWKGMSAESGAQLPASCKPRCTVSNGFTCAGLRPAVGYNNIKYIILQPLWCSHLQVLKRYMWTGSADFGTRWDAVVCVLPGTYE